MADGILAWAVAGYAGYDARGLDAPAAVEVRTASYKAASDIVGAFLDDNCTADPGNGAVWVLQAQVWDALLRLGCQNFPVRRHSVDRAS